MLLEYTREVAPGRLLSEIMSAIPELSVPPDQGKPVPISLAYEGGNLYIVVPDTVDAAALAAVVAAHDARPVVLTMEPGAVVAVMQTVTITATVPAGSTETTVTFQVEDGPPIVEPVVAGVAAHSYAFDASGIYAISAGSPLHGAALVEVTVE